MPNDRSPLRPAAGARWAGSLFLAALAALTAAGCGEESIRQYAAPKAEAPERVGLIGVIYPHGDLTWFFKLMGPESAVSAQAGAVDDFLKSVHFTDQGDRPMEWKLPEGWQPVADAKANNPGHYATLRIESKDKPSLEMTVTKFPGTVGGLLANVNRWRGQVGLSPIEEDDLDKDTRKEEFNGNPTTVVKLVGPGSKPGSGAPFMNLPARARTRRPSTTPSPTAGRRIPTIWSLRASDAPLRSRRTGRWKYRWPPPAATCCRTSTAGGTRSTSTRSPRTR